jgi:hypothetical protein
MTVRAKFKVESVLYTADFASVKLSPVVSGSQENKEFYRWTPGGTMELNQIRKEVADVLKPGQEFYVDLIPVEKA